MASSEWSEARLFATCYSPFAISERRLGLEQHAVALGVEAREREIGREGRAELDRAVVAEQTPIARAHADLEMRQHLVVDEGLGRAADAAVGAGEDVGRRPEVGRALAQQMTVVVRA